jgi:putative FmdB family regulatory protein
MPIFEFRCKGCGEEFELLIGPSGEERRCPSCGSEDIEKLISTFSATSSSESGETRFIGGGSLCSGCQATSCASCSIR